MTKTRRHFCLFSTLPIIVLVTIAGCLSVEVPTHTLGGTLSGLTGTIVIQNNGGDALTVTANGNFTFGTPINTGSSYSVTVATQPAGQACTVSSGTGTIAAVDIHNVLITCATTVATPKKMYLTAATHNGNFVSPAGADTFCMGDANYPGTGTYKALLSDGSARIACTTGNCSGGSSEHVGWILAATTRYTRLDGTVIGTTTADGIFAFPLDASIGTVSSEVWIGLSGDWTTTDNCMGWTSDSGNMGWYGYSTDAADESIFSGYESCDFLLQLYCVEQ